MYLSYDSPSDVLSARRGCKRPHVSVVLPAPEFYAIRIDNTYCPLGFPSLSHSA